MSEFDFLRRKESAWAWKRRLVEEGKSFVAVVSSIFFIIFFFKLP